MHLLVLLGLVGIARGADADPFAPASSLPLGLGTLQGEVPWLGADGPSAGLYSSVAEDLVVFRYDNGREAPILGELLGTELHGGYTFQDKLRVDLFLPMYPYAERQWDPAFQGAAFGDIRLQGTVPIAGEAGDAFVFGVVPRLGLPTGTKSGYLARGMSGGLTAAAGGELQRFGWVGNLGLTLSQADAIEGVTLGSTFDVLGGAWYAFEEGFRVGGDVNLSAGLARELTGQGNTLSTSHLFAQMNLPSGIGMTGGVGTGLVAGVGAPDYRLFAAVHYGNAERDKDKDGIVDDLDSCPIDPEDFDQYEDVDGCPENDNDSDGLADLSDRCPLDPEDIDEFADEDGCPELDNDEDGVLDADDSCPIVFGLAEFAGCPDTDGDGLQDTEDSCPTEPGPIATDGCPDRDSDLVPDFRDACPDEPKPVDEDPATSDGCPKRIYITGTVIKIDEQVYFETGKAIVRADSHGLLSEVAKVLQKHSWVHKVEVGGHTDDRGGEALNQRLSQARAQAVVDFLVKQGVDSGRLVAKGYGEAQPIDTNRTAEGRQNNRRVEFNITEQVPPTATMPTAPAPQPAAPMAPSPQGQAEPTPQATPAQKPPAATASGAWGSVPGQLTVNVHGVGWADVYIDDVKVAKTAPFTDLEIAPGRHTISVVNPRQRFMYEIVVEVVSGQPLVIDATKDGKPPARPAGAEPVPWGEQPPDATPWGTTD